MIISTIRMAIPAEKHNDAFRIIKSITVLSKYDQGCLNYRVYRDIDDYNVLMLQGYWKSKENLDFHIRSDEYRNLLLVLELSLQQPVIRFDTISNSTGIETIEKIRSTIHRG